MSKKWIPVAKCAGLDDGDTLQVELDENEICIYRLGNEFFATDNKCTHGEANLSDGLIQDDCLIECPLHEGTFDIRTGKAMSAPCTEALRCYEVKIEQEMVFLGQDV